MKSNKNLFLEDREEDFYSERDYIQAQRNEEYEELKAELSQFPVKKIGKVLRVRKYFPHSIKRKGVLAMKGNYRPK